MTGKPPPSYAPVYAAALYPDLAKLARDHGYALAVHGSLRRDFDLICIPWTPAPSTPRAVIDAITSTFAIKEIGGEPTAKEHGRTAYTLAVGFGECALDLSFMPAAPQGIPDSAIVDALNERDLFVNPNLLERAADEIDCGSGCENIWREPDVNFSMCKSADRGNYCPNDLAATLRAVAKIARAAIEAAAKGGVA